MFYERYGYNLNGNNARSFQLAFVIADVLNRAESYSPEDIRSAILETNIPKEDLFMPWNGIQFDPETGKNVYSQGIVCQIKDGRYYPVFPSSVATKNIEQFVPWSAR